MTDRSLLDEIAAEADRIRTEGSLPVRFEAEMRARFDAIALDPSALADELARREAAAAGSPANGPGSMRRRAVRTGASFARRVAGGGRRRLGPRLRAVQRKGLETAGRVVERAALEIEVVSDTTRRLSAGTIAERGLQRARPLAGMPAASSGAPRALHLDASGELADSELDSFLGGRMAATRGPVLHAESGDGSLVTRLRKMGLDAVGVDPGYGEGESRRGALEALARRRPRSLGGLVLSGVTDRMTPLRAQAMCRLAASRLEEGGVVVLLGTNPVPTSASDPIAADLSPGRPLHPVTWCHLLARLGLEEISVRESRDGSAYAVAAKRGS